MKNRLQTINVALAVILLFTVLGFTPRAVEADTSAQVLPFMQDWSNTDLITINDDRSGVPGIVGYLGDYTSESPTNVDPQTLLADYSSTTIDVIANLTTAITAGGVGEYDGIADPVVALQGSGTADAPFLLISIQTTGLENIQVSYDLRDIDTNTDDATQQVALHYRVGETGDFTNIPEAYIADATIVSDVLTTPVSIILPDAANNQPIVQLRIMTTNAGGSDEWVGIDNIRIVEAEPVLVINEIDYDQIGTDTAEFVEVKNNGAISVDLSSYNLQFINGASGLAVEYRLAELPAFNLAPDDYFVVCGNSGLVPNCDLVLSVAQDMIQNGAPDAIALRMGTNIVDTVSYEGDTLAPYTETFGVSQADSNTVDGSIARCPDGTDTDHNDNDFVFTDKTPGTENCVVSEFAPEVISTFPVNGATDFPNNGNIVITFNEPVTVIDTWFDISCTVSSGHTAEVTDNDPDFTLDPDVDFAVGETCTVTVYAANVYDDDLVDDEFNYMVANYSFTFTTIEPIEECGDPYTPIYDIQGDGMSSPLVGQEHATEGIVVGDFQVGGKDGYYIQDATGDTDPLTSDGVFVYDTDLDVNPGDHVRVRGTVVEYFNLTEISPVTQVWVCSTGNTIAPTELSLPVTDVTEFEQYEGMLVTIPQDLTISEYFNFGRYGEIKLTTTRYMTYTAANEPDVAGYSAWTAQYASNSITLDDGRSFQNPDPAIHPNGSEFTLANLFRGGDTVANVTGVIDYSYNLYRIQPTEGADYTPVNSRSETPEIVESDLKVASFNVLNYFLTLNSRGANTEEELARQRAKILAAMIEIDADVYGLMEIENDAGAATADLVAGLNDTLGAGTYAYIDTGSVGTDAIKQAILYKPASVTPVGLYKILDSTVDSRFIDTKNRPVIAQVFANNLNGTTFVVAVNHLKSKGSDCNDLGDYDLGDGAGNCNLTRKAAAEALVDWLKNPTNFPGVFYSLIIGDLNSYDKEDPIDMIKLGADDLEGTTDDYLDMMHEKRGENAYGYVYDGQMGYLDYAMVNNALYDHVVDVNFWHINADEPSLIDYDMTYKLDPQDALYAPDAYRSSDHDPVIITLSLPETYSLYLPVINK